MVFSFLPVNNFYFCNIYGHFCNILFLIKRKIKNITIISARARARKRVFLFWGDKNE